MDQGEWDPFLGDLRLLPEVERVRASPLLIVGRLAYVQSTFGVATHDKVVESLGPISRKAVEGASGSVVKVPMRVFLELDRAIFDHAFNGHIERFLELGERNAERSLSTVHRAFLWLAGNPLIVFRRLAKAYPTYYEPGEFRLEEIIEHGSQASIAGALPYHFCNYATKGWIKRAIELAGAKQVVLRHTNCRHRGADVCRWKTEWV
jgi:hypothetical protein